MLIFQFLQVLLVLFALAQELVSNQTYLTSLNTLRQKIERGHVRKWLIIFLIFKTRIHGLNILCRRRIGSSAIVNFGFKATLFHLLFDWFVFFGFQSTFLKALIKDKAVLNFRVADGDFLIPIFGYSAGLV